MELNAKNFSLQDAAGMQLGGIVMQLNSEVEAAAATAGKFDGKPVKVYPLQLVYDSATDKYSKGETAPTDDEWRKIITNTEIFPVVKVMLPGTGTASRVIYACVKDRAANGKSAIVWFFNVRTTNSMLLLERILVNITIGSNDAITMIITHNDFYQQTAGEREFSITGATVPQNTLTQLNTVLDSGGTPIIAGPNGIKYRSCFKQTVGVDNFIRCVTVMPNGEYWELNINTDTREVTQTGYALEMTSLT